MEIFLLILTVVLLAGGIIFSVLPPLPGPIITYFAMITTHFISEDARFSLITLVIFGIITALITVADLLLPVVATKKFGGTNAGMWGGVIGTILGVVSGIPFGLILGPLFGAIIGDLIGGNHIRAAMKSSFGSFLGFLVATTLKVVFSCIIGMMVFVKIGGMALDAILKFF